MINRFTIFAFIVLATISAFTQIDRKLSKGIDAITEASIKTEVDELCKYEYKGRRSGSEGYEKAAQYIASRLKLYGVRPCNANSYFQSFSQPYNEVFNSGEITVTYSHSGKTEQLNFPNDFYPGISSANGIVTAPLVYVGAGIHAPELGYSDYENIDVKGKIVAIETIKVAVGDNQTLWNDINTTNQRIRTAIEHGAIGVLLINKLASASIDYNDNIVYAHCRPETIVKLLNMTNESREEKIRMIKEGNPQSFITQNVVTIKASTRHFPDSKACNVIGMIKGSDPAAKTIILGAHLDGVGYIGAHIAGAFDNASGCANLLTIAKAFHTSKIKPRSTILFIFFGSEETGLQGSKHYVTNPIIPMEQVEIMFNLDMVGNGTDLALYWCESYPETLQKFINTNNKYFNYKLSYSKKSDDGGRPNLDLLIFSRAGYPASNAQICNITKRYYYHQIGDNPETLTYETMVNFAQLFFATLAQ